ncbi:hypothetical protein MKQ70_03020 [Chitinophaga sedimenti]|uniref:hypothetical protein n=1 Tax=Chitinophaga sedimenti TaxID=2033606 RepID=UPI0020045C3E|nr:hypothetical protein [Chitinophaga sedimenti]MCK7554037.1 hypothetical protein [Chitinophaga sedimenti]
MPELLVAAYQTPAGSWKSVPARVDKNAQQFVFQTTHFSDWIVQYMMELKPEKKAIHFGESVKLTVSGLAMVQDDLLAPLTPPEILEGLVKSFDWRLLTNSGSLTYNAQNECEATFTPDHPTGMSTSAEISVELDGNMKIRDEQAPGGFVIMKRMTLLTKIDVLGEVYMTGSFVKPINITDQVTALIANGHITINAHSADVSIMLEAFGTTAGTYLGGERGSFGNSFAIVTQNEAVPKPFSYSSQYTECGPPRVEKYTGTLTIEKWDAVGRPVQGSFSGSLRWLQRVVDQCPEYKTTSLQVDFRTVRGL